ncbi:MAG: alpha-2-macroglobulin family protein, partial [Haloferula sp.]
MTDQNGKPVEAALSLALVNEALYSLYPEAAPSILDFFQSGSRRNAEFRNASTCGFDYVGRTTAVVKSIAEEKERLERRAKEIAKLAEMRASGGYGMGRDLFRARGEVAPSAPEMPGARLSNGGGGDFDQLKIQAESLGMASKLDDLAAQVVDQAEGKDGQQAVKPRKEVMEASRWVAPVITDAQGRAEVRMSLPESTTQWRLTARGCTRDSLVGQGTSSLITRKDFFVELMSPALVQEGDKMSFLAKIHNLTDFEGEVKVSLKLEGEQGFVAEQSVQVVGKSVTECVFDALEIPLVEAVTLSAEVRGGKHADSLELEVPVRPWGIEYASSAGGVATGNVHGVVSLPEGRDYSRQELEVSLSPSLRQALIDQALRGGMGSQADALLAAVSALEYATAHEAPGEEILVLRKRVQSLISALTATQNDDGSWGWQSVADLYHSCRSYWALALARQQGFPLQPDLLSKAEGYLGYRFSKLGANDNESKSMILHVLSVTGKADFAHLNRIHRERAGLSSNALARTAIAMSNMERGDFAKELVDLLEQ